MEERSVNIKEVIYSVKKKSKMIMIFTLLCTLLATAIATFMLKPTYEAKVKIFAGSNDTESGEYRLSEVSNYKDLIGFYTEIIKMFLISLKSVYGLLFAGCKNSVE